MLPTTAINVKAPFALSLVEPITLSLSKLPLLHRMASNDNGKRKIEEAESSMAARKRLRHTNDDGGDEDSSDSLEEELLLEEEEEEVSSMKLDTSKEKLYARHAHNCLFGDNGDTPSTSSDTPPTQESRRRSDEESSNDDDWM
jgi:hypothetical protein